MKKKITWKYSVLLLLAVPIALAFIKPIHVRRTVQFDNSLPYKEIDGYKYHMEVFGEPESTPIIIVHGGPGLDYEYLKPLQALSKDYQVIFYDQRGTGLSPRVDKSYLTIAQSVEDLHSIVKHFSNGGKVKLIGQSWGGALIVGYLSKYPTTVSQAVIVEPAFLNPAGAEAWASKFKTSLPIWDIARYLIAYPFVYKEDGQEGWDYMSTKLANRDLTGPPYLCEGQHLPPNTTTRIGYAAYNNMMQPIIDNPESFPVDFIAGLGKYHGDLMLISSECSILGTAFQEQYNLPLLPPQTVHIKALKTGHHVLTLNPEWSIPILEGFFRPETPTLAVISPPRTPVTAFTPTTYTDDNAGFALDYPAEWTLDQSGAGVETQRGYLVQLTSWAHAPGDLSSQTPAGGSRMDINVYQWDPKNNLDAFIASRKTAWETSGISITSEDTWMLIGGLRAVRFQAQTPDEKVFFMITTIRDMYLILSGTGDLSMLDAIGYTTRLLSVP